MKKILILSSILSFFCCGYIVYQDSNSFSTPDILISNVEALATGEVLYTFVCEGNTGICAKGKDENTGHDFIIHGKLTSLK